VIGLPSVWLYEFVEGSKVNEWDKIWK
jgi:hypothetical protein